MVTQPISPYLEFFTFGQPWLHLVGLSKFQFLFFFFSFQIIIADNINEKGFHEHDVSSLGCFNIDLDLFNKTIVVALINYLMVETNLDAKTLIKKTTSVKFKCTKKTQIFFGRKKNPQILNFNCYAKNFMNFAK